ncbi:MAG: hypothetical protein Q8867_06410 [Bacteroidota bacterium]|nr:hypothetical protein [Bacteroidota bacterium]
MEQLEKILVFSNQFEAERMDEMLNDLDIPHSIIPTTDSVLQGIKQMEFGWGYLEAPVRYKEKILAMFKGLKK